MGEESINILQILSIILSSSVFVSIFTFIQWNKDKNIKHITEERKVWRKELRDIALDLSSYKKAEDLPSILSRLKVRINPKGMFITDIPTDGFEGADFFSKDAYIWITIKKIESAKESQKKNYINDLIEEICLLLKYDWNRSKAEIHLTGATKSNFFTYALFAIQIFVIVFLFYSNQENIKLFRIIGIFILVPSIIQFVRYKWTYSKNIKVLKESSSGIDSNYHKGQRNKNKILYWISKRFMINDILGDVLIYIILVVIFSLAICFFKLVPLGKIINLICLIILMISSLLFYFYIGSVFDYRRESSEEYFFELTKRVLTK